MHARAHICTHAQLKIDLHKKDAHTRTHTQMKIDLRKKDARDSDHPDTCDGHPDDKTVGTTKMLTCQVARQHLSCNY